RSGEAIKENESVLQLVNPDLLQVEAEVEVQDAEELRKRMKHAEEYRKAALLRSTSSTDRRANLLKADKLLTVEVDVSRTEAPVPLPRGHWQEVNSVAFTKSKQLMKWLVSASEDGTVRIWERIAGRDDDWREKHRLDHRAAVRAVACTPPSAKSVNLMLTG